MARIPEQTLSPPQALPHNDELERAALSGMLFDPEAVDAARHNHLKPADFYSPAHKCIYEAVVSLDGKSLRADIQAVIQELRVLGRLDEAGGAAYVSSLTSIIPSGANIEYYVRSVLDLSLRRALLKVASRIGAEAYDESRSSLSILNDIETRVFELRDTRQEFSLDDFSEVLIRTFEKIEEVYNTKKPLTGLSTGIAELDKMTTGFQPSEFIVIGARPSVGKTALALNIAAHMAIRERKPVAFFSLEMPSIALTQRLVSSEALVSGVKMRDGTMPLSDLIKIRDKVGVMCEAPFFIVDVPNMSLNDIRSLARKLRSKKEVEIIFIDYLGLIGHENPTLPLHQQIQEISRSLKSLARELKIPVVVLCQLNREGERSGQNQPPNLANIRDSGAIEQDADLVMFLHRKPPPKAKKEGEPEEAPQIEGVPTELHIAKQRNGPVGMIDLVLQSKHTRFVPLQKTD